MPPESTEIIIGSIIWIVITICGNTITLFGIKIENPILKKAAIFILFPLTGHLLIIIGKNNKCFRAHDFIPGHLFEKPALLMLFTTYNHPRTQKSKGFLFRQKLKVICELFDDFFYLPYNIYIYFLSKMNTKHIYPSKNPIHRLEKEMALLGFNKSTVKGYLYYISSFLKHSNKSPRAISADDIIDFLEEMVRQKKSRSTLNAAHSAFKFYFEKILNRKFFAPKGKIARAKLQKNHPVFLTEKEIDKLIANTKSGKYKLIFNLMKETGIKISEALNIQLEDLNFESKFVKISKGRTSSLRNGSVARELSLSNELLRNIKQFTLDLKKSDFIFTNKKGIKLTERAIQKIFIASLKKSNIYKPATCTSLRHSYALKMTQNGLKPKEIQQLLGHALSETAFMYSNIKNSGKIKKSIKNLINIK